MFTSLRARLPRLGRGPRLLVAATCVLLALTSALGSGRGGAAASRRGTGLAARLPAGFVAAAVSLDDPRGADIVRAGDRVDILETDRPADLVEPAAAAATATGAVATMVRRGLVLRVLDDRGDGDAALVLAVDRATALRLARDRSARVFTAVVVAP